MIASDATVRRCEAAAWALSATALTNAAAGAGVALGADGVAGAAAFAAACRPLAAS